MDSNHPMVRQYLETALWASSGTTLDGRALEGLDSEYGVGDFAPEAVALSVRDCEAFTAANVEDLALAGDDSQNGHDLWLTRAGHGVGFWDRGYGDVGERLTAACKAMGYHRSPIVGDDGLIYFE